MKIPVLLLAVLLAACGQDEPPPPEQTPQGRAETRSIRNTESIGYSGDAMADKVDEALDKNDQRVQETEKAAEE